MTPRTTTAPPATSTPSPTGTPLAGKRALGILLRDAAISEEMYYSDTGAYTRKVSDLQELTVPPGATLTIVSASGKGYCLSARGSGGTLYLDSDEGKITDKPCT